MKRKLARKGVPTLLKLLVSNVPDKSPKKFEKQLIHIRNNKRFDTEVRDVAQGILERRFHHPSMRIQ